MADQIEVELREAAPWINRPAFASTVRSLAWTEAELVLRRAWADDQGLIDSDGRPLPGDKHRGYAEGRAHKLRAELGLTPQSYASLVARIASIGRGAGGPLDDDALAALEAEGRQILESRDRALPEPDEPDHENGSQRPKHG